MSDTLDIEVGAGGQDFRYWRAKEAVRQAELLLISQADSRRGFETRITTIMGWVVAAAGLVVGGVLGTSSSRAIAGIVLLAPLLIAASICAAAIWPSSWGQAGFDPRIILTTALESDTELELTEAMATGYAGAIDRNVRWLDRASTYMRVVYALFLAGPVCGAAVLLWVGI